MDVCFHHGRFLPFCKILEDRHYLACKDNGHLNTLLNIRVGFCLKDHKWVGRWEGTWYHIITHGCCWFTSANDIQTHISQEEANLLEIHPSIHPSNHPSNQPPNHPSNQPHNHPSTPSDGKIQDWNLLLSQKSGKILMFERNFGVFFFFFGSPFRNLIREKKLIKIKIKIK
jgi:hypothetical protein